MPTPPVATRKRKRAHQYTVSYSEVQEVDNDGRLREVIVIEDTPPQPCHPPQHILAPSPLLINHPPIPRTSGREQGLPQKHRASLPAHLLPSWPSAQEEKAGTSRRDRTVRLLGQGTFGKVVEAVDVHTNNKVAIKIIRAIPKYRDASKIEVRVLQKLKERDPMNRFKCIHLLHWFDHKNHICLVSELLGMCLYDFLKENEFAPFPRQHIQDFARQLLASVAFLHDLRLVHTDLKPENILLVRNDYKTVQIPVPGKRILDSTDIRLIDFGSATFEQEYHSTVVCTRHYRAPEIILGLGWSYPCDAYSLGCILVEFFTGIALFQTHDNLEHLAMMEMVMGKMPERFARAGARSKPEFFKEGAKLDWPKPKASRQSKKDDVIPPVDMINRQFLSLVQKLLTFDPAERITVRDALNHPYFSTVIPNEL
ncbi:kinase-like domain-containing protein [Infundibulicybe gibba]|nr:kinase-like domain-containing protein [Infundibulicybe gibba]